VKRETENNGREREEKKRNSNAEPKQLENKGKKGLWNDRLNEPR
jgi:hypothetical protein